MVLPCPSRSAALWPPALPELRLAVAIADAIERLDLLEAVIDVAELLAQPLDVAVDGAVDRVIGGMQRTGKGANRHRFIVELDRSIARCDSARHYAPLAITV